MYIYMCIYICIYVYIYITYRALADSIKRITSATSNIPSCFLRWKSVTWQLIIKDGNKM